MVTEKRSVHLKDDTDVDGIGKTINKSFAVIKVGNIVVNTFSAVGERFEVLGDIDCLSWDDSGACNLSGNGDSFFAFSSGSRGNTSSRKILKMFLTQILICLKLVYENFNE